MMRETPAELETGGLNLQMGIKWGAMATWRGHALPLEPELCFEHRKKALHILGPLWQNTSLGGLTSQRVVFPSWMPEVWSVVSRVVLPLKTLEKNVFPFPLLLVALVYIHTTPSSASSSWPSSCPHLDLPKVLHQLSCTIYFSIFMCVCVHVWRCGGGHVCGGTCALEYMCIWRPEAYLCQESLLIIGPS